MLKVEVINDKVISERGKIVVDTYMVRSERQFMKKAMRTVHNMIRNTTSKDYTITITKGKVTYSNRGYSITLKLVG